MLCTGLDCAVVTERNGCQVPHYIIQTFNSSIKHLLFPLLCQIDASPYGFCISFDRTVGKTKTAEFFRIIDCYSPDCHYELLPLVAGSIEDILLVSCEF